MRLDFHLFSRTVAVGALLVSGLALVTFGPASAVGAVGSKASQVSRSVTPAKQLSGVNVLGWGFNGPSGIASDGTHVWVANYGNSVTELSASTGALVKVISGSRYGFNGSGAVASGGGHVWVANLGGNSVTELSASTGALAKLISGSSYGFNSPLAIASDGTRVWVANGDGQSITEFPVS